MVPEQKSTKKKKQIVVRLDEESHKDLKVTVAKQGTTIQDFVTRLIKENSKKQ